MTMDGDLKTAVKADLNGTVRLEGPIQIQMQGPVIRYEGIYISDELLDRVRIGETTDEWLLAVFGEPTSRTEMKDGSQIWRWTYGPTEQQASIVEVFGSTEKEPKLAVRSVFAHLRGGIVIEKWKG
ncbi:MAG: hypothetical protein KF745_03205 [Phycisphaeraceae bacterium]|nr:hypothetical protein [Phycisphaeraceae bacterium]